MGQALLQDSIVSGENLETKDYVIAFLSPLVPYPTFAATVTSIDLYLKGRKDEAMYTYLTQTSGGLLMTASIWLTEDENKFRGYLAFLQLIKYGIYYKRKEEFKEKMADTITGLVQKLKPKQVLYPYPDSDHNERYVIDGWTSSEEITTQFGITNLSSVCLFLADTLGDNSLKPVGCPDEMVDNGFTFCPQLVERNSTADKLIFFGNNEVNDKVQLEDNSVAYGMGGDDHFQLRAPTVYQGVEINGGSGNDHIDTTNSLYGSSSILNGGGPERDVIKAGPGNDHIVVDNDEVEATNGDNTILVHG